MASIITNTLEIGGDTLILEDKGAVRLNQGSDNAGKVLVVNENGNVVPANANLGGGSADTDNPFKGMKYCAVGDSITFGVGASDPSKRWADLVVDKLGLDRNSYQNLGVSNTTITVFNSSDNSICNRVLNSNIASDCELITLLGGVNDFYQARELGSLDDALKHYEDNGEWDTTNFCGAYCAIIDYVRNKRPNAHLIALTPMHYHIEYVPNAKGNILPDFVNAVREICEHFAVYVIDCYKDLPFDCKNAAQKALYTSNGVVPDGVHPSDLGHRLLANFVVNRLRYNYVF